MKMSILLLLAAALVCIPQINYVTSFTTPNNTSPPAVAVAFSVKMSPRILPKIPTTTSIPVQKRGMTKTSLHLYVPSLDDIHALTTTTTTTATLHVSSASSFLLSTIDSDIANIPDNEFRTVFAGGIGIMFGSILSTIFVGYLIEFPGGSRGGGSGYVDLVAETYVEQSSIMGEKEETFLNSLGLTAEQKAETEEMVRAFREKKMKKAGTWTTADEEKKLQLVKEKNMFSDYD